jgi:flagellar FliL protein
MAEAESEKKTEKQGKGGISIAAVLVITLIGAGAGVAFGFMSETLFAVAPPKTEAAAPSPEQAVTSMVAIKPLPPITANLAQPATTWIRLEASVVVKKDLGAESDVVASKIAQDIVGFLRTVTIDQISGPSGFQHLREDLNDRVRVRSEGKASELIIQSLILE